MFIFFIYLFLTQTAAAGNAANQGQTSLRVKVVVNAREGPNLPKHNKMLLRETLRASVLFAVLQAAQNKPNLTLSLGKTKKPGREGKVGDGLFFILTGHFREHGGKKTAQKCGLVCPDCSIFDK